MAAPSGRNPHQPAFGLLKLIPRPINESINNQTCYVNNDFTKHRRLTGPAANTLPPKAIANFQNTRDYHVSQKIEYRRARFGVIS
jgi:hypothetical protein